MTPTRNQVHEIFHEIEVNRGVVMRGHYMCCSSCAHAELSDKQQHDDYGFYHVQSTDAAAHSGWLYIGHGLDETAPRAIVAAFREAGCEIEWPDENVNKTIRLRVDAASFDTTNVENIPEDAESVEYEGATLRLWEDEYATNQDVWCLRIVTENNAWWSDAFPTRAEAIDAGRQVVDTYAHDADVV